MCTATHLYLYGCECTLLLVCTIPGVRKRTTLIGGTNIQNFFSPQYYPQSLQDASFFFKRNERKIKGCAWLLHSNHWSTSTRRNTVCAISRCKVYTEQPRTITTRFTMCHFSRDIFAMRVQLKRDEWVQN